jgi:hypothetical protein
MRSACQCMVSRCSAVQWMSQRLPCGTLTVWRPDHTQIKSMTSLGEGYDFVIAMLRLQPDVLRQHLRLMTGALADQSREYRFSPAVTRGNCVCQLAMANVSDLGILAKIDLSATTCGKYPSCVS